jgi:hypothetical protein
MFRSGGMPVLTQASLQEVLKFRDKLLTGDHDVNPRRKTRSCSLQA